ncbi:hypothetical protein B7463_g7450, partial [Scytalidium lignicola]
MVNGTKLTGEYSIYGRGAYFYALRCPDSLLVQNELREDKDKLRPNLINWIFNDQQYQRWLNDNSIGLLWIKGGAGKGKTMMSISLIDHLSEEASSVITYFFCRNTNYELNTIQAIIKGLILQLVRKQPELKESLRCRWDRDNKHFNEDITSWRALWKIFLEMLDSCKCQRIYVVVDALDECRDDDIATFLRLIVRVGVRHTSKVKWLLTSRPLDATEWELLDGSDLVQVSLELNSDHISDAVEAYVTSKVAELDKRHNFGHALLQKVESILKIKSEGTFLWVSLVFKRLEGVHKDEVLTVIEDLPKGLHPFYHRILDQLSQVDRCASLIRKRGHTIEFVHQSSRDYLSGDGQSILNTAEEYGHANVLSSCVHHLSERLKPNPFGLLTPDSTKNRINELKGPRGNLPIASIDYAATFWVRHLDSVQSSALVEDALSDEGAISRFLRTLFLEWLECLSLLDKSSRAIEDLMILTDAVGKIRQSSLSMFLKDATRFLLRHRQILATCPSQIYSSAIIFSPEASIVRRENLHKVPKWLKSIPQTDNNWGPLIQILRGHTSGVTSIRFSPDGKRIVSGSRDSTVRIWDVITGELQNTLKGHLGPVVTVIFSPDGNQIASHHIFSSVINVWDARNGELRPTLSTQGVARIMVFAPDGKHIVVSFSVGTVKLWNVETGQVREMPGNSLPHNSKPFWLIGFSHNSQRAGTLHQVDFNPFQLDNGVISVIPEAGGDPILMRECFRPEFPYNGSPAISPDRNLVALPQDETIELRDNTTDDSENNFTAHEDEVLTVCYSPDGRYLVSVCYKELILWDCMTGSTASDCKQIYTRPIDKLAGVRTAAFSPDSKEIALFNYYGLTLWNFKTGKARKIWNWNYVSRFRSPRLAFSPDSTQITVVSKKRIWRLDARSGDLQKEFEIPWDQSAVAVAFFPDGKQIATSSDDCRVIIWDLETPPNAANLFRKIIGSRTAVSQLQVLETSTPIFKMNFSTDGRHLVTENGLIKIKDNENKPTSDSELNNYFYVADQWIYYASILILYLPWDHYKGIYDVNDDRVAVAYKNGRVMRFDFDLQSLRSALGLGHEDKPHQEFPVRVKRMR